jgi:hypothetical protein
MKSPHVGWLACSPYIVRTMEAGMYWDGRERYRIDWYGHFLALDGGDFAAGAGFAPS